MDRIRTFGLLVFLWFGLSLSALSAWAIPRGVWVTRWDYQNAQDIARIMQNLEDLYASDIFFQVRGNGTVFYESDIEPWAGELTGDAAKNVGQDPGWDPLAAAIDEAQEHGIRLHAWMNVMPGWRGEEAPPAGSGQLWVSKRDWFMVDHRGSFMWPPARWYSFLSPGIPEVQLYLRGVVEELLRRYPGVQGLHLDYIRYPGHTEVGRYRNFSFDEVSVRRFREQYGHAPKHDSPEWSEFKRNQVTSVVRHFREVIDEVSPAVQLSSTFFADLEKATVEKGQDPQAWLNRGLVDWLVPMAYQRNLSGFDEQLAILTDTLGEAAKPKMCIGVLSEQPDHSIVEAQVEKVHNQGFAGTALFAYSSYFTNHQPKPRVEAIQAIWKEDSIREVLSGSSVLGK